MSKVVGIIESYESVKDDKWYQSDHYSSTRDGLIKRGIKSIPAGLKNMCNGIEEVAVGLLNAGVALYSIPAAVGNTLLAAGQQIGNNLGECEADPGHTMSKVKDNLIDVGLGVISGAKYIVTGIAKAAVGAAQSAMGLVSPVVTIPMAIAQKGD